MDRQQLLVNALLTIFVLGSVSACLKRGVFGYSQKIHLNFNESADNSRHPSSLLEMQNSNCNLKDPRYLTEQFVQKGKELGLVAWQSKNLLGTKNKNKITARMIALPTPAKGSYANGVNCSFEGLPYQKLRMKVALIDKNEKKVLAKELIEELEVGKCSDEFTIEAPNHNGELQMIIVDVMWDYSCKIYTQGGFGNISQCPWDLVWENDCYQMAIQVRKESL